MVDQGMRDRPEETEVTPEMIEAGASELGNWSIEDDWREIVRAVYVAMERAIRPYRV